MQKVNFIKAPSYCFNVFLPPPLGYIKQKQAVMGVVYPDVLHHEWDAETTFMRG
jgi:hypothetical protein